MGPSDDGDDDTEEKENSARERSLRLLTWNVNRAEPSGAAFDAALAHVRSLTPIPHVIALQLASKDFAAALAAGLGWSLHALHHSTPGSGWGSEPHGNAVLTDFRAGALATDAMDVQLPGAPPRSAMCVQVMIPECEEEGEEEEVAAESRKNHRRRRRNRRNLAPAQEAVWVCSVHLDNAREETRMTQAKELARRLRVCGPHVLCGDFNALSSRDFPPGEWQRLCGFASDYGWEPRQERVMRFLLGKRRPPGGGTPRASSQGRTKDDAETSARVPCAHRRGDEDDGDGDDHDSRGGGTGGGGDAAADEAPDDVHSAAGVAGAAIGGGGTRRVHYGRTVREGDGRDAGGVGVASGAGYDDAWEAAGAAVTGRRHTFRLPPAAGDMWVRLDYVLLSEGLAGSASAVEMAEVEGASNHSPITVDLRLH